MLMTLMHLFCMMNIMMMMIKTIVILKRIVRVRAPCSCTNQPIVSQRVIKLSHMRSNKNNKCQKEKKNSKKKMEMKRGHLSSDRVLLSIIISLDRVTMWRLLRASILRKTRMLIVSRINFRDSSANRIAVIITNKREMSDSAVIKRVQIAIWMTMNSLRKNISLL